MEVEAWTAKRDAAATAINAIQAKRANLPQQIFNRIRPSKVHAKLRRGRAKVARTDSIQIEQLNRQPSARI